MRLKIKKLHPSAIIPTYATPGACGLDLVAIQTCVLAPGGRGLITTGLAIELPDGFEAQIRPRSGHAWNHGVTVLNSPGTIDSDYRGEIKVILINHNKERFIVRPQMKIAQMVIWPVLKPVIEITEELIETTRGTNGFGSTGI